MFRMIKRRFADYVNLHRRIYYGVSLVFCLGLAFGVVLSVLLSDMRQGEIEDFVRTYCRASALDGINPQETFIYSATCAIKTTAILWLCCVSSLFIPVSGFVVISEGFGIGFTLGSLTRIFGLRGFALSFVSIFFSAVVSVPVIIHLACCSVYYALEKRRRPHLASDRKVMIRFCITTILCLVILILSALIDGYITPVFVKSISALF